MVSDPQPPAPPAPVDKDVQPPAPVDTEGTQGNLSPVPANVVEMNCVEPTVKTARRRRGPGRNHKDGLTAAERQTCRRAVSLPAVKSEPNTMPPPPPRVPANTGKHLRSISGITGTPPSPVIVLEGGDALGPPSMKGRKLIGGYTLEDLATQAMERVVKLATYKKGARKMGSTEAQKTMHMMEKKRLELLLRAHAGDKRRLESLSEAHEFGVKRMAIMNEEYGRGAIQKPVWDSTQRVLRDEAQRLEGLRQSYALESRRIELLQQAHDASGQEIRDTVRETQSPRPYQDYCRRITRLITKGRRVVEKLQEHGIKLDISLEDALRV